MTIARYEITDPTKGPSMSRAVVHGDTVYVCGVTGQSGDMRTQTRQALERVDQYLRLAKTDKSKLLAAQIWIKDMTMFSELNAVWNAWVDPGNPPVRACVRADMARPEVLVEIMVTASRV
jgi:enamine deaminase RidA (YjgF/YER057c/UK114 family)